MCEFSLMYMCEHENTYTNIVEIWKYYFANITQDLSKKAYGSDNTNTFRQ